MPPVWSESTTAEVKFLPMSKKQAVKLYHRARDGAAAGGYPSAAIVQFTGTAPTGSIFVTGQGNTTDDGFTGCPGPGPGQVGRWGDYGAATFDTVTGNFYTGNEMIPNPTTYPRGTFANWGTFITQAR